MPLRLARLNGRAQSLVTFAGGKDPYESTSTPGIDDTRIPYSGYPGTDPGTLGHPRGTQVPSYMYPVPGYTCIWVPGYPGYRVPGTRVPGTGTWGICVGTPQRFTALSALRAVNRFEFPEQ
eukprot:3824743-Rhodomonas_salina.1